MPRRIRRFGFAAAAWLFFAAAAHAAGTRLLRFPDVWHDRIVFSYAGDLWTASTQGGTASRLTSSPGLELFGKFSPDGSRIAFTAQYGGDEQVYVMPSAGGAPTQLTFYPSPGPLAERWGYDNQVYGWTPDGAAVLFRSARDGYSLTDARLYTVPVGGGLATALPMPVSGAGDFSPDGKRLVYSPLWRDFRSEKRYQGGWANDLYIFDLGHAALLQVTDDPHTDRDPMWIGGAVYFNSDRSGTFNLFRYDVASARTDQLTHYTDWDVRWPSADADGQIVYELDGELHLYDTRTAQDRAVSISVPDDGTSHRPQLVNAADNIGKRRHQSRRRARRRGGTRRCVLGTGRARRHPQPDAFLDGARSRDGMVQRWQTAGVCVGSQRRGGALRSGPGWRHPRCGADLGVGRALPAAALVGR